MSSKEIVTSQDGSQQKLACNVFAGSDIGYLKGINFRAKSFQNLNTVKKLNKKLGISCLCWGTDDESVIYAGCKGGNFIHHTLETGVSRFMEQEHDDHVPNSDLREICVHNGQIISAFHNGFIDIKKVESEGSVIKMVPVDQLSSLTDSNNNNKNLLCMDHNKSNSHTLATGGQENPLRVWDINNLSVDPVFIAKNVRNDWLNLRVPVWVTKVQFYPLSDKIVTGTGLGKVRMYDPSSSQRRPVLEVKCGEEYPVTAMAIKSNSDHQVLVGNTMGSLMQVDLRKKAIVRAFKGNKGGITDIKSHPEYPVFSVCSVDRYVRCYNPEKSSVMHSCYLNSSLNCILVSSKWDQDEKSDEKNGEKTVEKKDNGEDSGESDQEDSDSEEEDVWSNLEVVQKKRRIE